LVELCRATELPPSVVLKSLLSPRSLAKPVDLDTNEQEWLKEINKPKPSKVADRIKSEIFSEGQRYQRRFQFPQERKGKPARLKAEAQIIEGQMLRMRVALTKPSEQENSRAKERLAVKQRLSLRWLTRGGLEGERPVPSTTGQEDDLFTLLSEGGRYKPVAQEEIKRVLGMGLRGEQIYLPSFTCYNHLYQALGIAMDLKPFVGRPFDPPDERRDLERFLTYEQNWRFLRDLFPKLVPLVILPDVDLQVLSRICTMPEGVLKRARSYKEDLQQIAGQKEIPVADFSELLDRFRLWPVFYEVLRGCESNILLTLKGKIKGSNCYVDQKELEGQEAFDDAYYNNRRKAGASLADLRRRVILNFALYAAQKEILQRIYGDRLLYLSLESPMEDKRFGIRDKKLSLRKMPIIYPVIYSDSLQLDFL